MKKGRPPSNNRLVSFHLRLPAELRTRIDAMLMDFHGGKVPLGAVSEFVCGSVQAGLTLMKRYFEGPKK